MLFRIQYKSDDGWETIDSTRSEADAWYMYREYCLAHGYGKTRLVTTFNKVLAGPQKEEVEYA